MSNEDLVAKYDRLAPAYSSRYADPAAVARFYVELVRRWGPRAGAGASVLEISCADGFMTEALVRAGFRVTGLDLSPRMVEAADDRLRRSGLEADLRVADVRTFEPDREWDVVLAPMWTFFGYVDDPVAVLGRLAPATRAKAIVDLNPREHPVSAALRSVAAAGFGPTAWRPVLVPLRVRVGRAGLRALAVAGRLPPLRESLLDRKFTVAILGCRS